MKSATIKLPEQSIVEAKLHRLLYRLKRPVEAKEAYAILADALRLSVEQRNARRASSGELAWPNLVRFAARRLRDQGIIDRNSARGFWQLTATGREDGEEIERLLASGII